MQLVPIGAVESIIILKETDRRFFSLIIQCQRNDLLDWLGRQVWIGRISKRQFVGRLISPKLPNLLKCRSWVEFGGTRPRDGAVGAVLQQSRIILSYKRSLNNSESVGGRIVLYSFRAIGLSL